MSKEQTSGSRRRSAVVNLLLIVILLILANLAGSFAFHRFDLTSEKRYTLNPATIQLLENLDDIVYFKIYLSGDELPANYKRLKSATREMLDEFRAYSDFIEYEFIDPSAAATEKERNDLYRQLLEDGLLYTNPVEEKASGVSQTLIWPGAIVRFRSRTLPLQLLRSQTYANEEQLINRAVNDLEYETTNIIRKLQTVTKPRVAFIEGHGELDSLSTKDISLALEEYYTVERIRIDSSLTSLVFRDTKSDSIRFIPRFSAIIIAGPGLPVPEKDKFIIDQYIMRGGKVLWLLDRTNANMDSLSVYSTKLVYPQELSLDDQLFKYGARINQDLVADLRSSVIPLVVGKVGNQPRFKPERWPYFVLSLPQSSHPVVNNLNAIRFEFAGTVDTVGAPGVRKTVLLRSSKRSRSINVPARISLNILRQPANPAEYDKSGLPLAVLLEGKFTSLFANRLNPAVAASQDIGFISESKTETKMIVVGDADVIRNDMNIRTGMPVPLGYDRYTRELFGNRDFILNCVNYLCDDSGLISVRSRQVKLRLLDEPRIRAGRILIQMQNVLFPISIILIIGVIVMTIRRKRFSKTSKGS